MWTKDVQRTIRIRRRLTNCGFSLEEKARGKRVLHVRTPAGVEKFDQPIGSVIIPGPNGGGLLRNLREMTHEGGWSKYQAANGQNYWVGRDADSGNWVAVNKKDEILKYRGEYIEGDSESSVLERLDRYIKPKQGFQFVEVRKAKPEELRKPAVPKAVIAPGVDPVKEAAANYGVGSQKHLQEVRKHGLPDLTRLGSGTKGWDRYATADGDELWIGPDGENEGEYLVADKDGNVLKEGYKSRAEALLSANRIAHDTTKQRAIERLRAQRPDTEEERRARQEALKRKPSTGLAAVQRESNAAEANRLQALAKDREKERHNEQVAKRGRQASTTMEEMEKYRPQDAAKLKQIKAQEEMLPPESTVAFTGTRDGMTDEQAVVVRRILRGPDPKTKRAVRMHNGSARGADSDAAKIARQLRIPVTAHPAKGVKATDKVQIDADETRDEAPPLDRNKTMVDASDVVIATPKEKSEGPIRGSGTWATIRYARKQGKHLIIVWPDGTVQEEG